jgi:L-asparaginase
MKLTGGKPRICVLFCGGTIVMEPDPKTGALDVGGGTETILNLEPRLREAYDLNVIFIDNIDSSNMTMGHWDRLVKTISENYEKYDGFVITHGTNTMGYTSSALSFALRGIGKPVVLTGAQIPANKLESDARQNFVNAVKLAAMDISGVYVVFGSRIMLGCRAKKDNEYDLNAFKTFNGKDVGEIGIKIQMNGKYARRHERKLEAKPGFESNLAVITMEPGISGEMFNSLVEAGIQGFVLRAFGAGDMPHWLISFLDEAHKRKIPVVVTTQCPNGVTRMNLNLVGKHALETGVIQAFDMSMESMTTKLHWLLAHRTPYEKIKGMMETDMCGEVAPQNKDDEENG